MHLKRRVTFEFGEVGIDIINGMPMRLSLRSTTLPIPLSADYLSDLSSIENEKKYKKESYAYECKAFKMNRSFDYRAAGAAEYR